MKDSICPRVHVILFPNYKDYKIHVVLNNLLSYFDFIFNVIRTDIVLPMNTFINTGSNI